MVEEYVDWTGDDSLSIDVIVGDAAPDDDTICDLMRPIYAAVQDALDRAGESRFPYMTVSTRTEYDSRDESDPDVDGYRPR